MDSDLTSVEPRNRSSWAQWGPRSPHDVASWTEVAIRPFDEVSLWCAAAAAVELTAWSKTGLIVSDVAPPWLTNRLSGVARARRG